MFIGTYIWWGALSGAVCFIKGKTGKRGLPYMNKIFGVILILFAAVICENIFVRGCAYEKNSFDYLGGGNGFCDSL